MGRTAGHLPPFQHTCRYSSDTVSAVELSQLWQSSIDGVGDADVESMSYADAVLAVLPADDEAVVIARLAASAGCSLQDVVEYSQHSGEVGGWGWKCFLVQM